MSPCTCSFHRTTHIAVNQVQWLFCVMRTALWIWFMCSFSFHTMFALYHHTAFIDVDACGKTLLYQSSLQHSDLDALTVCATCVCNSDDLFPTWPRLPFQFYAYTVTCISYFQAFQQPTAFRSFL